MNNLAFEVGRRHVARRTGRSSTPTARPAPPRPRTSPTLVQHFAAGSQRARAGSCSRPARSRRQPSATQSAGAAPRQPARLARHLADRRTCSRASIRRSIRPSAIALQCAISSDDDPGAVRRARLRRLRVRRDDAAPARSRVADRSDDHAGRRRLLGVEVRAVGRSTTCRSCTTRPRPRSRRVADARPRERRRAGQHDRRRRRDRRCRPRRARTSARATSRAFRRRCSSRDRQPRRRLARRA